MLIRGDGDGSDAGGEYRYSADGAKVYGTLGIEGTTYEIGYDCVRESLGDGIAGKVFLDFGCGAGRSTLFLKALDARHVYGVDHDQNMLDLALAAGPGGVEFFLIADAIPLPDEAADGAISLTVFVEIRTMAAISRACREVARVLRQGSPFIVMSVSPMAFGHTFRSFGYPAAEPLQSGAITTAIVTAPGGQFPLTTHTGLKTTTATPLSRPVSLWQQWITRARVIPRPGQPTKPLFRRSSSSRPSNRIDRARAVGDPTTELD